MALSNLTQVVVGSTRVHLFITFTDENDQPINIAGATGLKCQGKSLELPAINIDFPTGTQGTIHDAAGGVAKFAEFGNAITAANLGVLPSATYKLRGKLTDSQGKIAYTPEFEVQFVATPI